MAPRNAAIAVKKKQQQQQKRAADNDAVSPPPLKRGRRGQEASSSRKRDDDDDDEDDEENGDETKDSITEKDVDATPPRKRARTAKDSTTVKAAPATSTPSKRTARSSTTQASATPNSDKKPAKKEASVEPNDREKATEKTTPTKKKSGKEVKSKAETTQGQKKTPATSTKPPTKKELDNMQHAARTIPSKLAIGAHVSCAGGVQNTIGHALNIGANSLACFLKSQRKWANPDLKEEHATAFAHACKKHDYNPAKTIVPHGSYLVNLAAPEKDKADQAYTSFLDDLKRCDRLGIGLYNFHPGNTNGRPRAEAIKRLAEQLNRAHKATSSVITLLENMAAAPTANTIGGRFEDLRDVIAQVEDKARVGVCLDTCHAFAAGYDLRSPEAYGATMAEFDRIIGPQYLLAVHLNDSKGVLGSHRDLHQNIGLGFLGLGAFHNVVNDARFAGVPMVLETPIDRPDPSVSKAEAGDAKKKAAAAKPKTVEDKGVWAREIKLLESLLGMDRDGTDFKELEARLHAQGGAERSRLQAQFDKKNKAGGSSKKKNKKKGAASSESDDDDDDDGEPDDD